jgi:soluble lytic murein transglycosylase-like protein
MRPLLALPVLLLLVCPPAWAGGWACWAQASQRYGVPVDLLYAVARIESSNNAHAIHRNPGGGEDLGLMQINSGWLPLLSKYGITREKLLSDACLNLNVGAWVLSSAFHDHGFNWRGLGAYNATTDYKRAEYARAVVAELRKVNAEGFVSGPAQHADVAEGSAQ